MTSKWPIYVVNFLPIQPAGEPARVSQGRRHSWGSRLSSPLFTFLDSREEASGAIETSMRRIIGRLISVPTPWGSRLQPRHDPWPRNWTLTSWFTGLFSTTQSHWHGCKKMGHLCPWQPIGNLSHLQHLWTQLNSSRPGSRFLQLCAFPSQHRKETCVNICYKWRKDNSMM